MAFQIATDEEVPLSEHLVALQRVLFISILALVISVITCFFYSEKIYELIIPKIESGPLVRYQAIEEWVVNEGTNSLRLDDGTILKPQEKVKVTQLKRVDQLLILGPLEGFFVSVKLAILGGILLSSPVWLYMLLTFIAPALREAEVRAIAPVLMATIVSGTAGFFLAKEAVIPLATQFFTELNQSYGQMQFQLSPYVDYCLVLYFSTTLLLQLVTVMTLLVHFGIISYQMLEGKRRIAYLMAFILGAIMTPPDVFSQVVAAAFLILFYELWVLYARSKGEFLLRADRDIPSS